jgi:NADH dehydrogenase
MKVLVTGSTGYVGHYIVKALLVAGHSVVSVSRDAAKSKTASGSKLEVFGNVEYRMGDVTNGNGLKEAMNGSDAVIHLVGIIAEKGLQTFQRVHVDGTRNVLAAAKAAGVKRYLHMSALGASASAISGYSSSKFKAEELLRASSLDWTIFRPSLVFGIGDDFFGHVLRNLVSQAPIVPQIGDGHFPFRPVWVEDVASSFVQALSKPETIGKIFDLVGPKEYTFAELLKMMQTTLGFKKPTIAVPIPIMDIMVPIMNLVPAIAPITKDQYAMLKAGNTGNPEFMNQTFQLEQRELEQELPAILGK